MVPFPTIDPQTVLRSARALDRYGPDFSYSHYAVVGPLPMMVGLCTAAGVAAALAQIPPTRELLLKLMSSGDGPSVEKRAKSWFRVRFRARAGDGTTVRTEVSGGDPGYGETSKMLAESALCLAFDDLPRSARTADPGGRDGRLAAPAPGGGWNQVRGARWLTGPPRTSPGWGVGPRW